MCEGCDDDDEVDEGLEDEEEDYSRVVQGTTETLLNKLEENLVKETLQECEPGELEEEGKDIDQVLGIISNSIYRFVQKSAVLVLHIVGSRPQF